LVTILPEFASSTPTGTVTVKDSKTTVCAISLSGAKGSCTLSAEQIPVGAANLVATYGGSAAFGSSTSAIAPVIVAKSTSRTVLKLSAAKTTYGRESTERLSVTVLSEFAGSQPTGTVRLRYATATLCAISLAGAKGSCTLSVRQLPVETYTLTASYGGSPRSTPRLQWDWL
jgi:hypothetical protein